MKWDSIVIGGGAAGYYFALASAKKEKQILLIEKDILGGTAFSTGCLPVKKMMDNLKLVKKTEFTLGKGLIRGQVEKGDIFAISQKEINEYPSFLEKKLSSSGVKLLYGEAEIMDNRRVYLKGEIFEAEHIIIATGTSPKGFFETEIDGEKIISHLDLLKEKNRPDELMILGANVEGVEFASLLCELGTQVTLVDKEADILPGTDADFIATIRNQLDKHHVRYRLNKEVKQLLTTEKGVKIVFADGTQLEGKQLLITGQRQVNRPKTKIDFKTSSAGYFLVDENFQTSQANIFAIGDVNGLHGMAHIAIQQGLMLSDYLYDNKAITKNYEKLPRCIFTLDEIAGVGLQVNQEAGLVSKAMPLNKNLRAYHSEQEEGSAKIVCRGNEVVGLWLQSIDAGNMMAASGCLLEKGMLLEDLKTNLWIHPTILEAFLDALIDQ